MHGWCCCGWVLSAGATKLAKVAAWGGRRPAWLPCGVLPAPAHAVPVPPARATAAPPRPSPAPRPLRRRFADGFPNLFVKDAIRIRNRHVAFLASFHTPGGCSCCVVELKPSDWGAGPALFCCTPMPPAMRPPWPLPARRVRAAGCGLRKGAVVERRTAAGSVQRGTPLPPVRLPSLPLLRSPPPPLIAGVIFEQVSIMYQLPDWLVLSPQHPHTAGPHCRRHL